MNKSYDAMAFLQISHLITPSSLIDSDIGIMLSTVVSSNPEIVIPIPAACPYYNINAFYRFYIEYGSSSPFD